MQAKTVLDPNISFREEDFQKVRNLIQLEESFNIAGSEGVGKSRFLRHLAYQTSFANSLNKQVLICYIDLRNISDNLLEGINSELKKYDIKSLDELSSVFENYKCIYIIFDESMLLLRYPTSEINKLRAIRDTFKYQLNFIFAFNNMSELPYEYKSLLGIAKYTIDLKPLKEKDMLATINYILDGYEFKLTQAEKAEIVIQAGGYPGKARELILNKLLGNSEFNSKVVLDREKLLESSLYFLTKNEYLVFKAMLEKPNYFIEKDDIAEIISPTSEGIGVSDTSIAQLIRRLRKKLSQHNANVKIKTKRGFGYLLD